MAVTLAVGLAVSAWAVAADDSSSRRQLIKTVSYTTGQKGGQLKWLPYRPADHPTKGPAMTGQPVDESQTQAESPQATKGDPFEDPFGDAKPEFQPALTVDLRSAQRKLIEPDSEPELGESLPKPKTRQPATLQAIEPEAQIEGPTVDIQESRTDSVLPGEGRLERHLAAGPSVIADECATALEDLRPIGEVGYDITVEGERPTVCPLGEEDFEPRYWGPTTYTWKASGLCHNPLYFEEVHLERYGHTWGPYLQPVISGAHFFLSVPALPYLMGLNPPCECMYTLGYYRPGSCAPYLLDPLPLSVRAAFSAGGVWTGMAFLIP